MSELVSELVGLTLARTPTFFNRVILTPPPPPPAPLFMLVGNVNNVCIYPSYHHTITPQDEDDKGGNTQPKLASLVASTAKETRARELAAMFRKGARRFNGGDFPTFPEGA